jgi:hypothetical protein
MSANIQGVAASFKKELLQGYHSFGAGYRAADTFKAALYYQNEGLGYGTTAYSSAGEVSGTGYTAGGQTVTNATGPAVTGPAAYWTPSAQLQWTGLTIASLFDCWELYNSSQSNRTVAVFTFPAQTVTAGTFTISMPPNAAGSALLQVS